MEAQDKKALRRRMIAARDALTAAERAERSARIVERILTLPAFRRAETVMLYRAVRGEVDRAALTADPRAAGKRFVYPLCTENGLLSLCPLRGRWRPGPFGIPEPDPADAEVVPPEEIDLVICPCTAFDNEHRRLGMGGGYYDRFLPLCTRAVTIAAAFEVQRLPRVPTDGLDQGVDLAVTEDAVY